LESVRRKLQAGVEREETSMLGSQCFQKLKDLWNVTPSDLEEQKKRLGGISGNTLKERRAKKVYLKCGVKDHT
jgi:hypothetical protein